MEPMDRGDAARGERARRERGAPRAGGEIDAGDLLGAMIADGDDWPEDWTPSLDLPVYVRGVDDVDDEGDVEEGGGR